MDPLQGAEITQFIKVNKLSSCGSAAASAVAPPARGTRDMMVDLMGYRRRGGSQVYLTHEASVGYARLRPHVGGRMELVGILMPAHGEGHDHVTLLLDLVIRRADE